VLAVPGGTHVIFDLQSVSGAQTTYITADHLGSANLLINSTGAVLINESYSAYGNRRTSNWAGPLPGSSGDYTTIASRTRRGYSSAFHEMLDNLGLTHMNGRIYDPAIGRFLSADPYVQDPTVAQSFNPYSYVHNNPLGLTDPSGFGEQDGKVIVKPIDCNPICPGDTPPEDVTVYGRDHSGDKPQSNYQPSPQPSYNVPNNNRETPGGSGKSDSAKAQGKRSTPSACTYAATSDTNNLAAFAAAVSLDDNLVHLISSTNASATGLLGEVGSVALSGASNGIALGIIGGEIKQGHVLDAALDSADYALGLVSSKYPPLLIADTAFNLAGGFKQIAKGVANAVCRLSGGN
jgi:RHS repeat-associated protein